MIVRPAQNMAAALAHLGRAVPFDCLGAGRATPAELVAGQALFDLVHAGRTVGAFALGVDDYSDGRVIRCGAAGGEPGHDLVGAMVGFAEAEGRGRIGARLLTCETRRPGLVRKLRRHGFKVAGYILSKDI